MVELVDCKWSMVQQVVDRLQIETFLHFGKGRSERVRCHHRRQQRSPPCSQESPGEMLFSYVVRRDRTLFDSMQAAREAGKRRSGLGLSHTHRQTADHHAPWLCVFLTTRL